MSGNRNSLSGRARRAIADPTFDPDDDNGGDGGESGGDDAADTTDSDGGSGASDSTAGFRDELGGDPAGGAADDPSEPAREDAAAATDSGPMPGDDGPGRMGDDETAPAQPGPADGARDADRAAAEESRQAGSTDQARADADASRTARLASGLSARARRAIASADFGTPEENVPEAVEDRAEAQLEGQTDADLSDAEVAVEAAGVEDGEQQFEADLTDVGRRRLVAEQTEGVDASDLRVTDDGEVELTPEARAERGAEAFGTPDELAAIGAPIEAAEQQTAPTPQPGDQTPMPSAEVTEPTQEDNGADTGRIERLSITAPSFDREPTPGRQPFDRRRTGTEEVSVRLPEEGFIRRGIETGLSNQTVEIPQFDREPTPGRAVEREQTGTDTVGTGDVRLPEEGVIREAVTTATLTVPQFDREPTPGRRVEREQIGAEQVGIDRLPTRESLDALDEQTVAVPEFAREPTPGRRVEREQTGTDPTTVNIPERGFVRRGVTNQTVQVPEFEREPTPGPATDRAQTGSTEVTTDLPSEQDVEETLSQRPDAPGLSVSVPEFEREPTPGRRVERERTGTTAVRVGTPTGGAVAGAALAGVATPEPATSVTGGLVLGGLTVGAIAADAARRTDVDLPVLGRRRDSADESAEPDTQTGDGELEPSETVQDQPELQPGRTTVSELEPSDTQPSELDPGRTQPPELQPTEPRPTEIGLPDLDVSPVTVTAEPVGQQRQRGQERDQGDPTQPTITEDDIVGDVGEPEQPGPSVREQQRREGLTPPEREFPTGEDAVVGRSPVEGVDESQIGDELNRGEVPDAIPEDIQRGRQRLGLGLGQQPRLRDGLGERPATTPDIDQPLETQPRQQELTVQEQVQVTEPVTPTATGQTTPATATDTTRIEEERFAAPVETVSRRRLPRPRLPLDDDVDEEIPDVDVGEFETISIGNVATPDEILDFESL